jgi:outer membrane lipoprotein-sorting protein
LNNPNSKPDEPFGLPDGDAQKLRDDLETVYRLPVPLMHFDPVATPARASFMPEKRRWRPALVGAAAAAGLLLFLAGPSLFGGSPAEVSAQEVFQRTQAVAATNSPVASAQSYHMVATSELYGPPGMQTAGTNSTTETWYQDAGHQRSESYDESGRLVFGQSQDGDDLWFYSTVGGSTDPDQLRVVHSTDNQMGFSAFGPQDFGVNSLNALLEMYSGNCASAENIGEETIAGRPAYVIEVKQTPETCDIKSVITQDGDMTTVKVEDPAGGAGVAGVMAGSVAVQAGEGAGISAGGAGPEPAEFTFKIVETTTRMWVDQETFITLKTETHSEDGLLFRYEVTQFEVSPDFDPSIFAYEPPAGVEVVEAEGPENIKIVLSGGGVGIFSGGGIESRPSLDSVEEGTTER